MKRENVTVAKDNAGFGTKDLFSLSIHKLMDNVLLKEMKTRSEIKTIAIISAFGSDGKSEISDNLACEFACAGYKTLLLSFKMIKQGEGEINIEPEGEQHYVHVLESGIVKTRIKNLDCLGLDSIGDVYAFPLDKNSLHRLLEQLKAKYKRIVIDTAALDDNVSGFIAADLADGVYFVCNRKNLHMDQVERHYKTLRDIGSNVIGIVYNNAEQKVVKDVYVRNGQKNG